MIKLFISHVLFRHYFENQNICQGFQFDSIAKICARGSKSYLKNLSFESLIAEQLGIQNFADYYVSDSFKNEYPYYLIIQPTFFDVRMDNIILQDNTQLRIQENEAHRLIQSLNQHFAEDNLAFEYILPDLWIIGSKQPFEINTTPLSQVIQRPIGAFMPKGKNQSKWGKFLNEVQMLFFSHAVNEQREQTYQLPINSVWIWGETQASVINSKPLIYSDQEFYQPLMSRYNTQEIQHFNDFLNSLSQSSDLIYIHEGLKSHALYQDAELYLHELQFLDKNIIQPILNDFKRFKQIECYCFGESYCLKITFDQWSNFKFWQMNHSLYALLK